MKWALVFMVCIVTILGWQWYFKSVPTSISPLPNVFEILQIPLATPSPTPSPMPIPHSFVIQNTYHIFQSFNNCGPAAFSMALSYYGISKTQKELGEELRPYQNITGDNDDKSVTLAELAMKAPEYNLTAFLRPNGKLQTIKQFIAVGIPVVTRTRLKLDDDIGHFRIIKGYDDSAQEFIQDDSFQGKNLRYSYTDFSALWQTFGFEYLVFVPQEKLVIVQSILGDEVDEKTAWKHAVSRAEKSLITYPTDIYERLNLSVALYHVGDYQRSVSEFEMVENQLPFRTLWYQIEPMSSYYELGNYARVFEITNTILNNHNRAFSELYLLRGKSYQKQGDMQKAKEEFEKAVLYNNSMREAREALQSISK